MYADKPSGFPSMIFLRLICVHPCPSASDLLFVSQSVKTVKSLLQRYGPHAAVSLLLYRGHGFLQRLHLRFQLGVLGFYGR